MVIYDRLLHTRTRAGPEVNSPRAHAAGCIHELPVASGILPDVEPGLPARRMGVDKATALWNSIALYPGGRMRALYGSQDGRHYSADNL